MSNANKAILIAVEKGYTATKVGSIISPFSQAALKLRLDERGYFTFGFKIETYKVAKVRVHRFIAYAKYGNQLFNSGIEVRHFDGNKQNNNWDNLLIGTPSQNRLDIPEAKRKEIAINAANKLKKLSNNEVLELRTLRAQGKSLNYLKEKFNISKTAVSYIINYKTYKNLV